MAAPATYDELRASIAAWLFRDDLDTQIPEFITFAEKRLSANVFPPERLVSTTLSASTASTALPSDFYGVRTLWIDGNPRAVLAPLEYGQLLEAYPTAGKPEKFTVVGGNLIVGPAPASTTTLNLTYWKSVTPLGPGTATNWLLTFRPDLYVAACLTEAFLFLKDEARAALWEQRTLTKIADAGKETLARWYSTAPLLPNAVVV